MTSQILEKARQLDISVEAYALLDNYAPHLQNEYCVNRHDWCFVGEDVPMLKELNEQHGFKAATYFVLGQLRDLNEIVGTKVKMNRPQMENCASLIIERHGTLKLTELMFFFRGCKSGDYGEFYGAVDIQKIMAGLKKFHEVRNAELDKIHKASEERIKKEKRERLSDGLLTKQQYIDTLYTAIAQNWGAERMRDVLVENGVKITIDSTKDRYPTVEECDPQMLLQMAQEREKMMTIIINPLKQKQL